MLGGLYRRYAGELERGGWVDSELFAWRALDALRTAPDRWGADAVYFYGFDDLTGLELDAVDSLSRIAGAAVTVSLTSEAGHPALAARARTLEELRPLAGEITELPARDEYYAPESRGRPARTGTRPVRSLGAAGRPRRSGRTARGRGRAGRGRADRRSRSGADRRRGACRRDRDRPPLDGPVGGAAGRRAGRVRRSPPAGPARRRGPTLRWAAACAAPPAAHGRRRRRRCPTCWRCCAPRAGPASEEQADGLELPRCRPGITRPRPRAPPRRRRGLSSTRWPMPRIQRRR